MNNYDLWMSKNMKRAHKTALWQVPVQLKFTRDILYMYRYYAVHDSVFCSFQGII